MTRLSWAMRSVSPVLGKGAGAEPTASAVSPISSTSPHAHATRRTSGTCVPAGGDGRVPWLSIERHGHLVLLRMRVADQRACWPTSRASSPTGVSIDALFQREPSEARTRRHHHAHHDAVEREVRAALKRIEQLPTCWPPDHQPAQEERAEPVKYVSTRARAGSLFSTSCSAGWRPRRPVPAGVVSAVGRRRARALGTLPYAGSPRRCWAVHHRHSAATSSGCAADLTRRSTVRRATAASEIAPLAAAAGLRVARAFNGPTLASRHGMQLLGSLLSTRWAEAESILNISAPPRRPPARPPNNAMPPRGSSLHAVATREMSAFQRAQM